MVGLHCNSPEGRPAGDTYHVDYLGVSGALVARSTSVLIGQYGSSKEPLHVLYVGCYNDLLKGKTVEEIFSSLLNLDYVMKEQEDLTSKPRGTNSLMIATVMTPPRIALMNGEQLDYSKSFYTARGEDIDRLNVLILENSTGQMGTHWDRYRSSIHSATVLSR